jgi:hypothetical protein
MRWDRIQAGAVFEHNGDRFIVVNSTHYPWYRVRRVVPNGQPMPPLIDMHARDIQAIVEV